jgi:hypothetical protein
MNFNKMRKNLLKEMESKANGKIYERIIPFRNNDIPIFLKKMDEFEKRSRKNRLVVKAAYC